MIDDPRRQPSQLAAILRDTAAIGFGMASDDRTGALLRVLAASKPRARFLELGSGTGLSAAWLLDGMDAGSTLLSIDDDERVLEVARRHLGHDPRVTFRCQDGLAYLGADVTERFDFIFADAWPGKYVGLAPALAALAPGGLYVIDDMLPQPNWPEGHAANVERLLAELDARADLTLVRMNWSTGIVIAVRLAPP
jgi:predicted O-methyltransferase YrrM